jgi:D-amino peptidase
VKVLIAADMEGIAGIEDYGECLPSHPAAYARGRRLMTDEVLAAVEALRAAGVEDVSVGDWHMVGTNVERERMPEGVEVRPIADLALVEADPSFTKAAGGELDAAVLIGHHAKTTSPRGFSSHTFIWEMEVELGGEPLSETQVFAQGLAAEGIPILVAAGDRRLLEELDDGELGSARLLATKDGQGRPGEIDRPRGGPPEAVRGDRRVARGSTPPAPRARLSGGAAGLRLRRGDRENDGRRRLPPAEGGRDDLQGEQGLARVPAARRPAPRRQRVEGEGYPPPPRRPAGDADDPRQGEALARLLSRPPRRGRERGRAAARRAPRGRRPRRPARRRSPGRGSSRASLRSTRRRGARRRRPGPRGRCGPSPRTA